MIGVRKEAPDTAEAEGEDQPEAEAAQREAERYSMLASAIAGRKVSVVANGVEPVYTDGQAIYLPGTDGDEIVIGIVIQGALLAAGSLDPRLMIRLIGRKTPTQRYLTLEAARAVSSLGLCVPHKVTEVVASHWEGQAPTSASESLERVLRGERIPEAPEWFGVIRPKKLLQNRGPDGGSPLTRKERQGKAQYVPMPELDDDDDSEDVPIILKMLQSPLAFDNPLLRQLRDLLGMGRRPKPDGQAGGAELPIGGMQAVQKVGRHAVVVPEPVGLDLKMGDGTFIGGIAYPEWDHERRVYRPAWCRVVEYDPTTQEEASSPIAPSLGGNLRRKLATLGLSYARHDHQRDGESLDVGALVNFAVAKSLGETPDERVYQARLKTARDLGVVVVLDASGSTAEQMVRGVSIWNEQRQLAADLIGALEQVGDRVAAYGFRSRGRQQVQFLWIKDFNGRFDQGARRRLASLEPSGFTRVGAAVRHGTHLLQTHSGTAHKLLVLISDGFAYDDDYQGAYAERDTRRALSEAVDQGVGCVCVSVGSSTDQATLDRLWGSVTHVDLAGANELDQHVLPMFRSALRAATAPRNRSGKQVPACTPGGRFR